MNSMYSKLMSQTVIYSKDNIEITEDLFQDGSKTYTGKNNSKDALRTYIQTSSLEDTKEYILNKKEM